ncbi:signal recognition particle-docking protein FtsY [Helcococcus sueciensis]|uniref:signal recognition particle-docking protein FtsY n=1 Tax=Helcococcus sueciensis TaxID=241555 RepID=UPI000422C7A0|nr:signal recognition particle-docking protein FtsY [Helcococcus sueciensis]
MFRKLFGLDKKKDNNDELLKNKETEDSKLREEILKESNDLQDESLIKKSQPKAVINIDKDNVDIKINEVNEVEYILMNEKEDFTTKDTNEEIVENGIEDNSSKSFEEPVFKSSEESLIDSFEEPVVETYEETVVEAPVEKKGFFERLKTGLFKTRDAFNSAFDNLINGKAKISDELYEELEELLISADIGVETTIKIVDQLRDVIEEKHIRDPKLIKNELEMVLKDNLRLRNKNNDLNLDSNKQAIILVIGVNGVGKTTTIGKLAYNLQKEGKSVMLAAADTFRAAAIEQLTEWANRSNVEIIKHGEGSDPASVVFDAIKSQKASNTDVLIIDTAGRLHNKVNLMNELEKINRIIEREHPEATKERLLILDATTGQNAIYQAKEFNKVTELTGIVLTKLDGTAKGGVVFPLQVELDIPVKYIGIGEQKDNLEKFDSDKFVDALFK